MRRLNEARMWGVVFIATLIALFSQRVQIFENPSLPSWFGPLATVLLSLTGAQIARLVINWSFQSPLVRKRLMGSKFVEGHWYLRTIPAKGENMRPELTAGVAYMRYESESQEFKVETTRIGLDGNSYSTVSEVAHLRTSGPLIRYLNFFRLSSAKGEAPYGFSFGWFTYQHGGNKSPQNIQAYISIENEEITRRQIADRIPDDEVRRLIKEHKDDWVLHYIEGRDARSESNGNDINAKRGGEVSDILVKENLSPGEEEALKDIIDNQN